MMDKWAFVKWNQIVETTYYIKLTNYFKDKTLKSIVSVYLVK